MSATDDSPREQESEGNYERDEAAMLASQHHTPIAHHNWQDEEQISCGPERIVRQQRTRRGRVEIPWGARGHEPGRKAARNGRHKTQQKPRHWHRHTQHRRHSLQTRHGYLGFPKPLLLPKRPRNSSLRFTTTTPLRRFS